MPLPGSVPDPDVLYPLEGFTNTVLLRPLLAQRPGAAGQLGNITVGRYSYYSDDADPLAFFERNVRYNYGFSGARLDIGPFCAIAHGATIIMPDANHAMVGPSTFPFPIFAGAWRDALPLEELPTPTKGDTVIGPDVWLGTECLIMPGVTLGAGAIVAARAVVTQDVPPYAVVTGNPARIVRTRYEADDVARLLTLAWWEWPAEVITDAIPTLVKGTVAELEALAPASR
ncbi:MAG: CatB-related O-acetyltransferase [Rhodospirillaceae bacterium]